MSLTNSVPPAARSRSPLPGVKSSPMCAVGASALRLVATKGASCRGPWSWIARATRDFPLPDGPVTIAGRSLAAITAICLKTTCIADDEPMSVAGVASGSRAFPPAWPATIARAITPAT